MKREMYNGSRRRNRERNWRLRKIIDLLGYRAVAKAADPKDISRTCAPNGDVVPNPMRGKPMQISEIPKNDLK